jgi:hypothetical protein
MRSAILAFVLFLLHGPIAQGTVHGEEPFLPENCRDRMGLIFTTYYSVVPVGGVNCSSTIRTAIGDKQGSQCPDETILQNCFNVSS